MQSVALRLHSAFLVILTWASAKAQCPVTVPAGMWAAEATYQVVMKGKQVASVPPIGQGFNRTLELTNFCGVPAPLDVAQYDCVATGAMRATLKDGLNSSSGLVFGGMTCSLSGIKVGKKADDVEAFFEFSGCTGGGSAAITVLLEKAPTAAFNILPWMKQVEGNCIGAPLPPSGPKTIDLGVKTQAKTVGAGQCAGTAVQKKAGTLTQAQCQSMCAGEIIQGHDTAATCTGFAYKGQATGKPGDEHCFLYNTTVKTLASKDGNWTCLSMTVLKNENAVKKVTDKVVTAMPLKLDELLTTVSNAFMTSISPPTDSPDCFKPVTFFTLEDKDGQPAKIHVPEADWDELLGYLKETPTSASGVSAPQVLDRVMFNPCGTTPGWGSQTCSGAASVTSTKAGPLGLDTCKQEETINSIVTGCLSSIGTWILVGIVYRLLKVPSGGAGAYDPLVDSEKPPSSCSPILLLILCGVAVGGAVLCSWASTYLLNAIMRSDSCLDFDEVLVAILSSFFATAIAITLSLWFLAKQYPNQPHPLLGNKPFDLPKNSKLLLVEVPVDSKDQAFDLKGDIMASGGSFTSQTQTQFAAQVR